MNCNCQHEKACNYWIDKVNTICSSTGIDMIANDCPYHLPKPAPVGKPAMFISGKETEGDYKNYAYDRRVPCSRQAGFAPIISLDEMEIGSGH